MGNNQIQPATRMFFLDNLRTVMIFFVVLLHSALVYEKSGFPKPWWVVYEGSGSDFPGILFFIMDICVMFIIFFISGYLVPKSIKNKSTGDFVLSKVKRLLVPWALAALIFVPVYKYIFLYSRQLPQQEWTTYFHFTNGGFGMGWLWFLPVLFLFDILYLFLNKLEIEIKNINLTQGIFLFFLASVVYSFTIELAGISGWTKTWVVDFQNERLLPYFAMFLLGALAYQSELFSRKTESKTMYYVVNGISWLPILLYLAFFLYPYLSGGKYIISKTPHMFIKWVWFYLSLLSMLYIFVKSFQLYLNRQGKVGEILNSSSYHVYIVHMAVLGILAVCLLRLNLHPMLKFLLLTLGTWILSNILSVVYRAAKRAVFSRQL
jgi:surface polysaccharide O-acyltransferase-like enzyme